MLADFARVISHMLVSGQPAGAEKLGVIVLWIEIKTADCNHLPSICALDPCGSATGSSHIPRQRIGPDKRGTEPKACHWSRSPSRHSGSIDLC
jgi:hypothetical protein